MGIEQDAFLACCLRHLIEKPNIDFDGVAKELGLSTGGAKNKFRDIMKKINGDSIETKKPTTGEVKKATVNKANKSTAKAGTKRKAPTTTKGDIGITSDIDDEEEEISKVDDLEDHEDKPEPGSPSKKQKIVKPALKSNNRVVADHNDAAENGIGPSTSKARTRGRPKKVEIEVDEDEEVEAEEVATKPVKNSAATKGGARATNTKKAINTENGDEVSMEPKPQSKGGRSKASKVKDVEEEGEGDHDDAGTGLIQDGKTSKVKNSRGRPKHTRKLSAKSISSNADSEIRVNVPAKPAASVLKKIAEHASNEDEKVDDDEIVVVGDTD